MDLLMYVIERMIQYFGPVPWNLLDHLDDEEWCSKLAEIAIAWSRGEIGLTIPCCTSAPEVERFVGRMLDLDPEKRATVNELLEDP